MTLKRRSRQSPSPATSSGIRIRAADFVRLLKSEGRHGQVRIVLRQSHAGMYVEREDIPRHGMCTLQFMRFEEAESFVRWCDADPLRFDHPLLHTTLKHDGDELWHLEPVGVTHQ